MFETLKGMLGFAKPDNFLRDNPTAPPEKPHRVVEVVGQSVKVDGYGNFISFKDTPIIPTTQSKP